MTKEIKWHNILVDRRAELEALDTVSADARNAVELDQSKVGRLSRIDAMQRQAMNKAVALRRRQEIARIDSALVRLEDGEFGYCMKCGEDIEIKRLELNPASLNCAKCAK